MILEKCRKGGTFIIEDEKGGCGLDGISCHVERVSMNTVIQISLHCK
jgi:hypothetical protein